MNFTDAPSPYFTDVPSPYFNDRPEGVQPSLVVLHFTGGKSFDYALETLTKARAQEDGSLRKVSAHYLIREDGAIFRLVDESKRAWHAGVGSWKGSGDVNDISIGIEISNRDRKPYTPEQLAAVTALCHDIQNRYNIPPQNVIGHSDIAPDRKDDPGYHFPWALLAKEGMGVMPQPKLRDYFRAKSIARNPKKLRELFNKAGYKAENLEKMVGAFQQHYEPTVYTDPKHGEKPGTATAKTVAKLRAVARYNKKHG